MKKSITAAIITLVAIGGFIGCVSTANAAGLTVTKDEIFGFMKYPHATKKLMQRCAEKGGRQYAGEYPSQWIKNGEVKINAIAGRIVSGTASKPTIIISKYTIKFTVQGGAKAAPVHFKVARVNSKVCNIKQTLKIN